MFIPKNKNNFNFKKSIILTFKVIQLNKTLLEDKMKKIHLFCSVLFCSVLFSKSSLCADDDNKKDELIIKILKPDDSQKINSFDALGPIGLQLKQLTEKFGQNKEKFQNILLHNLNQAGPNSSGMDSQEAKDAYKSNFTAEELQYILDLRKNVIWLKTNNPEYQGYFMNRAMKRMMGPAMPNFMVNFIKQIVAKAEDAGLVKNVSDKLLSFFQKEIDTTNGSEILKTMRDQYDQQIKQSALPKASDGVTPEKIALAGEYTSHIYNPDQMMGPIMMMVKMILNKATDQAGEEKEILPSIIDAFIKHEGNTLLNQFYIETFVKASEKAMAEIFTLQELKEMIALQNQSVIKKFNEFNRKIISQIFMKSVKEGVKNSKEGVKNPDSFVRNAVNKALEKAKELNLISGEALSNIQKEVLEMKL
jgi:predicted DNA-binding protein (UPF0278 family)